tara:strand:+ start:6068 stop:6727 length:660 start_codon:yes stop_codon:yes gene_type:complete
VSSTNRGGKRSPADYYPTPAWCVDRLLERLGAGVLPTSGSRWVEPCAGEGDIVRAVGPAPKWHLNELRDTCRPILTGLVAPENVTHHDVLAWQTRSQWDVCITNPPFSLAFDVMQWSLQHAHTTCLLLRLNWLGGGRSTWLRAHTPDVYVLPNRPSFDGRSTDSIEYAWFVWSRRLGAGNSQNPFAAYARTAGRLELLDATDVKVRSEQKSRFKSRMAT